MSLFTELRRRNVFRVGAAYAVIGWLILQIGDVAADSLGFPGWFMPMLFVLLGLGFPVAVVLAWAFELTPDGMKRTGAVQETEAVAPPTGKRMDRLIVAGLTAVVLVVVADRYWPRTETAARLDDGFASASTPADDPASATGSLIPVAAVALGIAVLPFDNFSPDPDNAYFASGVYEEVLTKLSRIGALRVISRTSMERIAKEDLQVGQIGERVGVSHVLEGSVRRAGDQVRVTVQLIEAATDAHLWAESYDRDLDDVFAIQSEIALAIADQLKLSLSAQLQADLGERPTQNQAAYELYLKAIDNSRTWRGAAGFGDAIDLLEPAVRLDPEFLAAQVMLAEAYGRMYWLRSDPDGRFLTQARQLVAHIGERWPDRPAAELARAQLSYNVDRYYGRALQAFEAVRLHMPNHPDVLVGIAASLKRLRRYPEFLAAARIALTADPEAPARHSEMLLALIATQRYAEGVVFAELAERKFPEDLTLAFSGTRIRAYHDQNLEPWLALGQRLEDTEFFASEIALARYVRDEVDAALEMLESASGPAASAASFAATRAELLRLAGRVQESGTLARRAYTELGGKEETEPAAVWYASLAWLAAEAGERDAARDWQIKATAKTALSLEERSAVAHNLSGAQRALGDFESAWQLLAIDIGDGLSLPNADLTLFRSYYDRLFGESPSYRDYMAGIDSEARP